MSTFNDLLEGVKLSRAGWGVINKLDSMSVPPCWRVRQLLRVLPYWQIGRGILERQQA